MPPLRCILRAAPDERRAYVHGFVAETLAQSPEGFGVYQSCSSSVAMRPAMSSWSCVIWGAPAATFRMFWVPPAPA